MMPTWFGLGFRVEGLGEVAIAARDDINMLKGLNFLVAKLSEESSKAEPLAPHSGANGLKT